MLLSLVLTLLVAAAAGAGLEWLGLPAAWLLGPLGAAVVLRLAAGVPRVVPPFLLVTAQALLGLDIGLSSRPQVLGVLGNHLWALAVVVLITVGVSMAGGYVLARWAGVDAASGFLGSIPGAASGMVGMSAALGADARVVAALQYLRVMVVAVAAPLLVGHLPGAPALEGAGPPSGAAGTLLWPAGAGAGAPALLGQAGGWFLIVVGVPLVLYLAPRLHLPAPYFIGPMILGLALRWSGLVAVLLPAPLRYLALVLVGVSVGARFDRDTLNLLGRAAVVDLGVIAGLLATSVGVGYLFHLVTGVDIPTALLGAIPGAMDVVTATAHELGADGTTVAAMHLVRFLVAALAGPWLAGRLIHGVGTTPEAGGR